MLVLVGIKVSQVGGIARKMTWFQVSGCHSLQFPWHVVCETWCQRFVAGGVRATRRDLKLRTKMFWECGYVNLCRWMSIEMLLRHLTVQSRARTQRGVLLSCSFFAPCQADAAILMILSRFGKRKSNCLAWTSQDKKVEIQRFPAAFPILCLHDANGLTNLQGFSGQHFCVSFLSTEVVVYLHGNSSSRLEACNLVRASAFLGARVVLLSLCPSNRDPCKFWGWRLDCTVWLLNRKSWEHVKLWEFKLSLDAFLKSRRMALFCFDAAGCGQSEGLQLVCLRRTCLLWVHFSSLTSW